MRSFRKFKSCKAFFRPRKPPFQTATGDRFASRLQESLSTRKDPEGRPQWIRGFESVTKCKAAKWPWPEEFQRKGLESWPAACLAARSCRSCPSWVLHKAILPASAFFQSTNMQRIKAVYSPRLQCRFRHGAPPDHGSYEALAKDRDSKVLFPIKRRRKPKWGMNRTCGFMPSWNSGCLCFQQAMYRSFIYFVRAAVLLASDGTLVSSSSSTSSSKEQLACLLAPLLFDDIFWPGSSQYLTILRSKPDRAWCFCPWCFCPTEEPMEAMGFSQEAPCNLTRSQLHGWTALHSRLQTPRASGSLSQWKLWSDLIE